LAKIYRIKIKNFRGIKEFEHTFEDSTFICFIGSGDSGKSTILEAINYTLSSTWNLTFFDSDFYNCEIENSIEIEITLTDLPDKLLLEEKFGLYIRGIDLQTNTIHDELEDDHVKCLTIVLTIKKDLEPKWYVINERNQRPEPISAYDRARLNVFMVADHLDRHFSWSKGNPLYALFKKHQNSDEYENENAVIEALRDAKKKIDKAEFKKFDEVLKKVKENSKKYGLDIENTSTTIDFRDISIKDGRVCLHEENIPFRLKGKGSKRLISIAIQTSLADSGGIILIDEIEQGLESYRVQHLTRSLKKIDSSQIFISSHSRDVLVELNTENLFLMRKDAKNLIKFEPTLQGCLRKNPEAFFAKKVLVCEGATEIGVSRAFDTYRIAKAKESSTELGIRFADGTGNEMIKYCKGFIASGFNVCLFCDSDKSEINIQKQSLINLGVKIIDSNPDDCLEDTIAKNLMIEDLQEIIDLYASIILEDKSKNETTVRNSIWQQIEEKYGSTCPSSLVGNDTVNMRKAFAEAMKGNENRAAWFKSIYKGELLGNLIFKKLDGLIDSNKLKKMFKELSDWFEND